MSSTCQHVVGIDLGGTNMQIGVVDAQNKIVGTSRKKTKAQEGDEAVIGRLVEGVQEACEAAGVEVGAIDAVGIGAPGAIDYDAGVVAEAPNLRWNDVPLRDRLSEKLDGLRVVLDNDVNAGLYGEWKMGAARGVRDALGVWVGTGIGGALILNGSLYRGHFNTAGEVGHTVLFPGGPIGNRTLESWCARSSVARRLATMILANEPSSLQIDTKKGQAGGVKSKALATAYSEGDELVRAVVDEAAEYIGLFVANMVTVLSLPTIVLGGGLTEAIGGPLVERVQAAARKHVFPDRCRAVRVVESTLKDNAGLLGAAMLAREQA